jgi:hypothetical protein
MSEETIEILEGKGFLEARVSGPFSLDQFKQHMQTAAQETKQRRLKCLLLDVRGLVGTPSTMERHDLGRSGVENKVDFRVAALITPVQAQDNFASTVARNRGVNVQTFAERAKALEWLLGAPESP